MRHSAQRSSRLIRLAVPALVIALSVAGYLATRGFVEHDRQLAAERRVEVESVRTQAVLDRARAYVVGLGNALAGERKPDGRRFAQLQGAAAGSVGLTEALWVEPVSRSQRAAYERANGVPITRLTPSGRYRPAPEAASYLPVTFSTGARDTAARRGVDVSDWPALAAALRDRASVLAVTATRVSSLGRRPGFFLQQADRFGRGPGSQGFLVVFIPQGWLSVSLEDDPRRVAVSLDGRRLEGRLDAAVAASGGFDALGRRWRIDMGKEPAGGVRGALPWIALAWPLAVAGLVYVVGTGLRRRRRAEREVERIFDLSHDLLGVASLDGYFVRVNPAFERTLGYDSKELLRLPFLDFVHPDDRGATAEAVNTLSAGGAVTRFENRYLRPDGSVCWLQWSTRPVPEEGLVYVTARDVTEDRRTQDQLREAWRMVEASSEELRDLAEEQAALRRVATLVARGGPPHEVFDAVVEEVSGLLGADAAWLLRFEPDGSGLAVALCGDRGDGIGAGDRIRLGDDTLAGRVQRVGGAVRIDGSTDPADPVGARLRGIGVRTAVAAPVVVEGGQWGVMGASWLARDPALADAELRIAKFTELVATAIANAESRAELAASRARVVAAADATRRRIERDLHDGAQQRLVSLTLALRAATAAVEPRQDELRADLEQTADGLVTVLEDLQEMSRGIHPAILSRGGLGPALKALARRSAVPVELDAAIDARLPEPVEVAAYYVVSEALANVAKHAQATTVWVGLVVEDGRVSITVRDDGIGGADPAGGTGLVGLRDRVEALGGSIDVESPVGRGTRLRACIPVTPPPER